MTTLVELCVRPYAAPYDRYECLFAAIDMAPEQNDMMIAALRRGNIWPIRGDYWWPVARALCRLLYSQAPADDTGTIDARTMLVRALETVWYIIYTHVYDIAPPCAWASRNATLSTKLRVPVAFVADRAILKCYERLLVFRRFIYNGVCATTAASIVYNLYCLQPRNIRSLQHPKVDMHVRGMVRDCVLGGKFWVAHCVAPYDEWDVVLGEERRTDDKRGV